MLSIFLQWRQRCYSLWKICPTHRHENWHRAALWSRDATVGVTKRRRYNCANEEEDEGPFFVVVPCMQMFFSPSHPREHKQRAHDYFLLVHFGSPMCVKYFSSGNTFFAWICLIERRIDGLADCSRLRLLPPQIRNAIFVHADAFFAYSGLTHLWPCMVCVCATLSLLFFRFSFSLANWYCAVKVFLPSSSRAVAACDVRRWPYAMRERVRRASIPPKCTNQREEMMAP